MLRTKAFVFLAVAGLASTPACAADLVVLSSQALKPVLEQIAPAFEAQSGDHLVITFDTSSALKKSIDAGAPFDVAILTPPLITALIKDGKADNTGILLARSGLGLAVKKGAKHPDISSTDALKHTLSTMTAAYITTGVSGTMFLDIVQKLGIADDVKARAKTISAGSTTDLVAKGEADLAVQLMPELTTVSTVDVVGPFPPEVQSYVTMTGAFAKATKNRKGAETLIAYLKKPEAAAVMRAKGMDPS